MRIGNLGSDRRAVVGGGGVVHLDETLSVSYWIGGEDRWHIPAAEITQRQSLVDDAPVVRTATRVPGGDIVITTYAARQGRRDLVVTEIENASKTPVAIAIALRDRDSPTLRVDANTIVRGDRTVAFLPRSPQLVVAAVDCDADLVALLRARAATPPESSMVAAGAVAVLLPVTHGAAVRFALALNQDPLAAAPVLAALPDAEQVARGWELQRTGAMRLSVPSPQTMAEYRRLLAALLLSIDSSSDHLLPTAALATALGRVGWIERGGEWLVDLNERQGRRGGFDDDVTTTACLAEAIMTCRVEALVPVLAGALEFVAKRAKGSPWAAVLGCAVPWLSSLGETAAAKASYRAWESSGRPFPMPPLPIPPVPAMSLGADFVPDDLLAMSQRIRTITEGVARANDDGSLDLFGGVDAGWRGEPLEAHDVPVLRGSMSVAVRWHGKRPALLWDVRRMTTGRAPRPLRLVCRSLDPSWSTTDPSGEALLRGY